MVVLLLMRGVTFLGVALFGARLGIAQNGDTWSEVPITNNKSTGDSGYLKSSSQDL